MLRRIVEALRSRSRELGGPPAWIAFTGDGFELRHDEALVGGVKWNEIHKILAFKRDMVTSDLVCLEFQLVGKDEVFEVNDNVGGFWDLAKRVKKVFPDSDHEWEESVVKPVFARNANVIYERPTHA